jgi:uncharacterized membrane protein
MASPFLFDRTWHFEASAADVWSGITRTDAFPKWWTWLREFDSDGIYEGAEAHAVIRAPLAYSLRLDVSVSEVIAEQRVVAAVTGDLVGAARVELREDEQGTQVRMQFELELRDPWLRRFSVVARPLMVWAHDVVCDIGVRQFERHAIRTPADRPAGRPHARTPDLIARTRRRLE